MKRRNLSAAVSLLRPMLAAAWRGAEQQPPAVQADIYAGIAHVTRLTDRKMSRQAARLCHSLREAGALQMHFRDLFTENAKPNTTAPLP